MPSTHSIDATSFLSSPSFKSFTLLNLDSDSRTESFRLRQISGFIGANQWILLKLKNLKKGPEVTHTGLSAYSIVGFAIKEGIKHQIMKKHP